jgi:hypothetical protein
MSTNPRTPYPPIVRALLDDDEMTRVDPRILCELSLLTHALRDACRYDPHLPPMPMPLRLAPLKRAA